MYAPTIFARDSMTTYCFDLDGTICDLVAYSDYDSAIPDDVVVKEINRLYDQGHIIKIMTARGSVSGKDHTELTKYQLGSWGLKHHELIMGKKPYADLFVDDRAMHVDHWKQGIDQSRGFVAGAFDLIHPGYIKLFKQAKSYCNHLTVGLHIDPSLENGKTKVVHTLDERKEILSSIKFIDDIIVYQTESELYDILSGGKFDVRLLGLDYLNSYYTGKDLPIKIAWIDREHGYSTTNLREKIKNL